MADTEYTRDLNLQLVWNTLMFFACESSYTTGERTGGVLQGCPRNPPPRPDELAGYGREALAALCRFLGREPEDWMLSALPSASLGEQQEAMERAMAAINKRDERIEAVRQWFAQWEQVMPLYLRHEFETAMPWAVAASPASKGAGEPDAVAALEAALPVLQDYASRNPMHFYRDAWQDPRGVHAAVKLVKAALGQLGTSPDQQEQPR